MHRCQVSSNESQEERQEEFFDLNLQLCSINVSA